MRARRRRRKSNVLPFAVAAVVAAVLLAFALSGEAPRPREEMIVESVVVPAGAIRYVPIGDSYTIGHAVAKSERWPEQLAARLRAAGEPVYVVANPAATGFTAQDALDRELPLLSGAEPALVTVQIGVNDWVQGVPEAVFRQRLGALLDAVLAVQERVVVVTVPDFSAMPAGAAFAGGRDVTAGLAQFNQVIVEESAERGLAVVDVFGISQAARGRADFIAIDGLHPSGAQYAAWVDVIYPAVARALRP